MGRARRWLSAVVLAVYAGGAACAVFQVTEPWVRPAGAGTTTEAFMQLASSDGATLVDVRTAAAAGVVLATAGKRQSPPYALDLPPRATVTLAPGRTRLLLRQVARPLKLGEHVPLTLVLRNRDGSLQEIEVEAEVRKRSASDEHGVPHRH